jgi:polyisoprenyl-teichoic acid--peptidoglycan teichoic acid transferase
VSPDSPDDRSQEPGGEPAGAEAPGEPTEVQPATWAGRRAQEQAEDGADDPGEAQDGADDSGEAQEGADDTGEAQEGADDTGEAQDGAYGDGAGQPTVEADTLAIADQEAAREAALAGVRARTEEQAAKRRETKGSSATVEAPAVAAADGAASATEVGEEDVEAPEVPPAGPPTPLEEEEEEKPPRVTLWARFVAASFLIVASMATATAVSVLVYLSDIAEGLGGLEGLQGNLTEVESDAPQNFLILGSDKRTDEAGRGRSDTTMLLRIDPDNQISLLSIPRDLKVDIPGLGEEKFNAAYSYGGPKLTLKVVKQITGLEIHHVVNVDFLGFAEAVNAIDCVYIDVDRHYYIPPELDVAEIDIEAGYQRLCGLKALQYVRYRHTDNDLVRSARQQDFLREARQKVPPFSLLNNSGELIDIFKEHTESDIDGAATMIGLIELLFDARNAPVREIHFPATLGGPTDPVTADSEEVQSVVQEFLNGEPEPAEAPQGDGGEREGGRDGDGGGDGGSGDGAGGGEPQPPPEAELADFSATGEQFAVGLLDDTTDEGTTPILDFPVFYPTRLTPDSAFDDESRAFQIDGPGDDVYRGYKLVVTMPGSFGVPAYYGVSGTDWKDPPILENPSEEREIDGRTYQLFYDGDRLRLVAFKTDRAVYWVNNTLTQELSEGEMLGIAQSLTEYTG